MLSRLPKLMESVGLRGTNHSREIAKLLRSLFSIILSVAKSYFMSLLLQMCSLSYKGYPRGIEVEGTLDDEMMVSAIMNVLALRFWEGNKLYAFCTNFPTEREVKNLAQVRN